MANSSTTAAKGKGSAARGPGDTSATRDEFCKIAISDTVFKQVDSGCKSGDSSKWNGHFQREDWTLFRNLQTIGQRAGAPVAKIADVVAKELMDNGLDAGGSCEIERLGNGFCVQDSGLGIPGSDEEIASLFSIARCLTSSKLLRRPTRGALGNGDRVVAGAVLASEGTLVVSTRGRTLRLVPRESDGGTTVAEVTPWEGDGTRVEVQFGPALHVGLTTLLWAETAAIEADGGRYYKGRTSAWWYDSDSFYELLQAAGDRSVRSLIEDFEGCSGRKAGSVAADLLSRPCNSLSRDEADDLLHHARMFAGRVKTGRLGDVGHYRRASWGYGKSAGEFTIRPARGKHSAEIPYVVECWATPTDSPTVVIAVNRTPITSEVIASRCFTEKALYGLHGCGLSSECKNTATPIKVGRGREFMLWVNITTPYMPITTDGKAPDLSKIRGGLTDAIEKAVRCAKRLLSSESKSSTLPRRKRGRQSEEGAAIYDAEVERFVQKIQQIRSRLDFAPSSRGYCYVLENEGTITKGDFGACQTLITDCRKAGILPLDICCEDSKRQFEAVESVDDETPEEFALRHIDELSQVPNRYLPISFWDDRDFYIQMLVEKIDLRQLFLRICTRFRIPIGNAGGWSDLLSLAGMMRRFAEWESKGKTCVLLYAGDFDPSGVLISDTLRSRMGELQRAAGWDPENLVINRFGLNRDFIEEHELSWIDGLVTGSGRDLADPRHPDHKKPYVQKWLREIGPRKVEANALVVAPEAGRALCLRAITQYVAPDAPEQFNSRLDLGQKKVRAGRKKSKRRSATMLPHCGWSPWIERPGASSDRTLTMSRWTHRGIGTKTLEDNKMEVAEACMTGGNSLQTLKSVYGELAPIDHVVALLAEETNPKRISDFSRLVEAAKMVDSRNGERRNYWSVLAIWSGRRLGEVLADMPKATGKSGQFTGGNTVLPPVDEPPTLENLGIEKMVASRAQRLADISEEAIREYVDAQNKSGEEISKAGLVRAVVGAHVGHNSGENEWYTPSEYIDAARKAMGSIDLDPASTSAANKVVKASVFYTEKQDGLSKDWTGNVWLNPPYSQPLIGKFADKLAESVGAKEIARACVLVNNATETKWFQCMAGVAAAICFPAGRVKFWSPDRDSATPLQGQAVIYAGKRVASFTSAFSDCGFVATIQ